MENSLYARLADVGGMEIPLNQPRGRSQNLRLKDRSERGQFPERFIRDEPANRNAQ